MNYKDLRSIQETYNAMHAEGADIKYPTGEKKKFTKDKSDPKVAAGRKAAKEMGLLKKEEAEVNEKYQGMYQSPAPTHNRLKSSDEKARMSPGRRAMAKSDELERSEPGSKRAKAQKKASLQMARNFKSARATKEEVDVFDIVKEHLIGEGLTEEEALAKMVNMTAEEKAEILAEV